LRGELGKRLRGVFELPVSPFLHTFLFLFQVTLPTLNIPAARTSDRALGESDWLCQGPGYEDIARPTSDPSVFCDFLDTVCPQAVDGDAALVLGFCYLIDHREGIPWDSVCSQLNRIGICLHFAPELEPWKEFVRFREWIPNPVNDEMEFGWYALPVDVTNVCSDTDIAACIGEDGNGCAAYDATAATEWHECDRHSDCDNGACVHAGDNNILSDISTCLAFCDRGICYDPSEQCIGPQPPLEGSFCAADTSGSVFTDSLLVMSDDPTCYDVWPEGWRSAVDNEGRGYRYAKPRGSGAESKLGRWLWSLIAVSL
jgi:hypothetical protein